MSDIFREVDEDLRREQYKRLWDRFGSYVIGLAVLIVVAVGGFKAWEWWETSRAAATGDRFLAALVLSEEGKHDEAIAALDAVAVDGSGDYPMLAIFRSAGEKAAAGDGDGAVAAYDAIATRSGVPPLVGDLARIRAALILADSESPQNLISRIGDLAADRQSLAPDGPRDPRPRRLPDQRPRHRPQILRRDRQRRGIGAGRAVAGAAHADADPVARGPPPPAEPEEG